MPQGEFYYLKLVDLTNNDYWKLNRYQQGTGAQMQVRLNGGGSKPNV
jgi:hypothetical protein